MVFFFQPPEPFTDREQYFDEGNHLVVPLTKDGISRAEGIPFTEPYLNFSQSAWDAETDSLYTWKKNFRGRDHLMRVSVPGMRVEPVARFPQSGGSPLLAFDTDERRILVAPRYGYGLRGLTGGKLVREIYLYDLDEDEWIEGELGETGLFTVSYSQKLDRYIALGRRVGTGTEPVPVLFHLDGDGALIESVPTNLLDVLASPVTPTGLEDALGVNHPGLQSRVLGDELILLRYVDLGRSGANREYEWNYEMYALDPMTGASRLLRSASFE